MEDGVEVVINHLEPYKINGEPSVLNFEEEMTIDFARDEFAELGLRFPEFIDVDSEGSIYVGDTFRKSEYLVDKFDPKGKYTKSFGRRGQGPGELQYLYDFEIYVQDRIMVSDPRNMKTAEFDKEGRLVSETRYPPSWKEVIPLENGNFLALRISGNASIGDFGLIFGLFDSNLDEINRLDLYDLLKAEDAKKVMGRRDSYYRRVANGKIYIGNEQRGYEILVYDLDGDLLKKIRKEYKPAEYPEEFREEVKNPLKYSPPFNSFFIDDNERLFVMTYEKGMSNEGFVHDIFNSDGVFIGRTSIPAYSQLGRVLNPLRATSKNNRFYRLRHKKDGNLALIVYKMIWE